MIQLIKPPFKRFYLNGFMLYNMLGHLWLDGKECPWIDTDKKSRIADDDKMVMENDNVKH